MKKIKFLFASFGMFVLVSCGNTEEVKSEIPVVETVSPEIGPAQEFGAKLDNAADSVKADAKQTKTEVGQAIDTAKKDIKTVSEKIKTETNKAANNISKTAKQTSETIKKETNKAADNVKKAAKDVKKDLSN